MGEQGEQGSGRNGAGTPEDTTAATSATADPTGDGVGAPAVAGRSVRAGDHRGRAASGVRLRRAVQKALNLLAIVVRLVACLFAVILLVRIGLAFVAVNPHNAIVEWIVRAAGVLVWNFRDLFLPADPRIGLVANYGLAAVFWVVVGVIAAWLLSGLGRLIAGRSGS
ncbi:MAG: hypothetical protein JOY78_18995 [Pseudonocardia sp.]|nr:hypothetical protein [Pseudonocardia sp.]